jgi:lysophospholipase
MTLPKFDRRAVPSGAAFCVEPMRDGWPVRRFDWPVEAARGSILFLGGRGDMIEKYLESFAHWHGGGLHISAFDWRGQGGSGRLSADPKIGHIERFSDWIDDLAEFYARWVASTPAPHIVIAHSMGGHLTLRALIEKRIAPGAAILCAPMLGFITTPLPGAFAAWIARRLAARGPLDRAAWAQNEKPTAQWKARQTYLTSDAARYSDELWWKREKPELDIGPPSWQWLLEAYASTVVTGASGQLESVETPILMLGTDGDKLVSPQAIRKFAARLPNCELTMFDKSVGHEILRERDDVRTRALGLIDSFLERTAKAEP